MSKKLLFLCLTLLLFVGVSFGQEYFPRPDSILVVLTDTSSTHDIIAFLKEAGARVFKTDTSKLDSVYAYGSKKWSDFYCAIIVDGTGGANVDTSLVGGVGDVNVLIFDADYWSDFGFPDSSGTYTIKADSVFRINDNSHFITSVWSVGDTIETITTTGGTISIAKFGGGATGTVLLTNKAQTDTFAIVDTLNGRVRIAGDFFLNRGYWEYPDRSCLYIGDFVARCIATVYDTSRDGSQRDIVGVMYDGFERTLDGMCVARYAEFLGHNVYWAMKDSMTSATFDGTRRWDQQDLAIIGFIEVTDTSTTDSLMAADIPIYTAGASSPTYGYALKKLGIANDAETNYVGTTQVEIVDTLSYLTRNYFEIDSIYTVFTRNTYATNFIWYTNISSKARRVAGYHVNDVTPLHAVWAHHINKRRLFLGYRNFMYATADGISMVQRSLNWLLSPLPNQPSVLTATAISTDSIAISWTDNESNEDGYSVFLYTPDSTWFSHLPANTTSDTLTQFWPPNSQVIWDVAVISGTDTVFSIDGRDTTYTLAATPHAPVVVSAIVSDFPALIYTLNGYNLFDDFSDGDYINDLSWQVQSGGWAVDTVSYYLYSTASSSKIALAYSFIDNLFRDSYFSVSFGLTDTLSFGSQYFELYFLLNTLDLLATNGYKVKVSGNGTISFYKITSGAVTSLGSFSWSPNSYWHDLKIKYDWAKTPTDSSASFVVYFDFDSSLSISDMTYTVYNGDFFLLKASNAGIKIDNFYLNGITPVANHYQTPYALQETNSGKYVNPSTNTLQSGIYWGYYSDFGSAAGDTLQELQFNTQYIFKLKAKNGRTK